MSAGWGGGASSRVPRGFRPETAAAVGSRDLWVLGEYRCGGWCLALVRSTDAGQHFTRAKLPSFPAQGPTASVVFANARDGFAYLLYGTSALYVTHDGGESWHAGPGGGVLGFATGGGWAYVATRRNGVERSPVSTDAWRRTLRLTTQYPIGLAARGARVWLLGPPRRMPDFDSIRLSSNHGLTFTTRRGPCLSELGGRLAAAGGDVVWAVCPTGMLAQVRRSADGGRSFARTRAPVVTNGGEVFPISPRKAFLAGGADGPLRLTTDGGKRWRAVKVPFRIAQLDWLGFTSRRLGFALVQTRSSPASTQLWRTTDGAATWHTVPVG